MPCRWVRACGFVIWMLICQGYNRNLFRCYICLAAHKSSSKEHLKAVASLIQRAKYSAGAHAAIPMPSRQSECGSSYRIPYRCCRGWPCECFWAEAVWDRDFEAPKNAACEGAYRQAQLGCAPEEVVANDCLFLRGEKFTSGEGCAHLRAGAKVLHFQYCLYDAYRG